MIRRRNFNIVILLLSITTGLFAYILVWLAITDGPLKENKIINIKKNSLLKVATQLKKQKAIKNIYSSIQDKDEYYYIEYEDIL